MRANKLEAAALKYQAIARRNTCLRAVPGFGRHAVGFHRLLTAIGLPGQI